MKRRSLLILTMFAAVITFFSCEKDLTTSAVIVDTDKTANLKVIIYAELDTLSDNDTTTLERMELVPDGTEVIVSVNNADLNPAITSTGKWIQNVTTSNGEIELQVPTVTTGVTVHIDVIGFENTYRALTETRVEHLELIDYTILNVMVNQNRVEVARGPWTTTVISSTLVP